MGKKEVLLAIDGGTHETGWALFRGSRLSTAGVVQAPKKAWTHIRIGVIVDGVAGLILTHKPDIIVCEGSYSRWTPELGVLIKTFKRMAREAKTEWVAYNAATVIRTVSGNRKVPRLRGDRKALLAQAVAKHYPKFAAAGQDTLDAICIGRTHLIKVKQDGL